MNIPQFRESLKVKWLAYYRENHAWLARLGVWVSCEGQRRPSSGFILATLSILEPQLTNLLPLIVDLSSNPDRIVMALGLNFNPDEALEEIGDLPAEEPLRMLPGSDRDTDLTDAKLNSRITAMEDETCQGVYPNTLAREPGQT
jgi:hypothetical protein